MDEADSRSFLVPCPVCQEGGAVRLDSQTVLALADPELVFRTIRVVRAKACLCETQAILTAWNRTEEALLRALEETDG